MEYIFILYCSSYICSSHVSITFSTVIVF